jgi:hypothetical protein
MHAMPIEGPRSEAGSDAPESPEGPMRKMNPGGYALNQCLPPIPWIEYLDPPAR